MSSNRKITIIVAAIIVAVGVTVAISSSVLQPAPLEEVSSGDNNNNDVVIDMTTQQWKFLPIKAEPGNKAELESAPAANAFSNTTITVNKGALVTLRIKNLDVTHGFGLDEFGISQVTLQANSPKSSL